MNNLMKAGDMNFSKKTFAVATLAAAISLSGCSSDDPDAGSAASLSSTAIEGVAVDGYLFDATVYVDVNNNGRKNAGEPSAVTDKDGYFSRSKDGKDYCSSDATTIEKSSCLKVGGFNSGDNLVIRTIGGFDLFTGEPFEGSLAARVEIGLNGVVENQMVSPLTSVIVDATEDDKTLVLSNLGLLESDLNVDFLDDASYVDGTHLNRAIKLHKVVTLLAQAFSDQYDAFGEERSFPETPNAIIYKALAASIADEGAFNSSAISAAFVAAQTAITALYNDNEDLSFPGNANGSKAIDDASEILGLVDNAIPDSTVFADAKKRVIGVETVVKKMLEGDGDVAAAITEASNAGSGLYTAIQDALAVENGDADFLALKQVNFNSPDYGDVAVVGGNTFTDLANKQLYLSFTDGDESGSGYLFFNGDLNASAGDLKLCLKYVDDSEENFLETDGVLLSGIWKTVNSSRLTLKLAGSISLSLTDKGETSDAKQRYSLSYGGETRSWISDDGLLDELESQGVVEQPTNNTTCKSLLISTN